MTDEMPDTKWISIPACTEHAGQSWNLVTVGVPWTCIHCGGPRGERFPGFSFDGSRRLPVTQWRSPCGHIEHYDEVRRWVLDNQDKVQTESSADVGE